MIKRITVALDADTDTPVATRYATSLAAQHGAAVAGVALVDTGSIAATSKGGGIGSMYLMDKVKAKLTEDARKVARELTSSFQATVDEAGLPVSSHIEEGVPLERILEDMKVQDVLVIGKYPHFDYSHPTDTATRLDDIVAGVPGPCLVVPDQHRQIRQVLVAYDGSVPCVRALRSFLHLKPFGKELSMEVLTVHGKGERDACKLALHAVVNYCAAHGMSASSHAVRGREPAAELLAAVDRVQADLLVAGGNVVSVMSRLAFGSTTASLLKEVSIPMWLHS